MITLFLSLSVPPLAVALLLDWMRGASARTSSVATSVATVDARQTRPSSAS
ncbi:MAG: hypothetical protein JOZ69_06700 [Myxococcales bacterium]|nr:hypothetical protein [Myxococcales bacterium]